MPGTISHSIKIPHLNQMTRTLKRASRHLFEAFQAFYYQSHQHCDCLCVPGGSSSSWMVAPGIWPPIAYVLVPPRTLGRGGAGLSRAQDSRDLPTTPHPIGAAEPLWAPDPTPSLSEGETESPKDTPTLVLSPQPPRTLIPTHPVSTVFHPAVHPPAPALTLCPRSDPGSCGTRDEELGGGGVDQHRYWEEVPEICSEVRTRMAWVSQAGGN